MVGRLSLPEPPQKAARIGSRWPADAAPLDAALLPGCPLSQSLHPAAPPTVLVVQRTIMTRSDLNKADIYGADFTNALIDKTQQMVSQAAAAPAAAAAAAAARDRALGQSMCRPGLCSPADRLVDCRGASRWL
jgi:hypothetical protein